MLALLGSIGCGGCCSITRGVDQLGQRRDTYARPIAICADMRAYHGIYEVAPERVRVSPAIPRAVETMPPLSLRDSDWSDDMAAQALPEYLEANGLHMVVHREEGVACIPVDGPETTAVRFTRLTDGGRALWAYPLQILKVISVPLDIITAPFQPGIYGRP